MNKKLILKVLSGITVWLFLLPTSVNANYSQRDDVKQFISKMQKEHGFDANLISRWMAGVKQQKSALDAIARPAEGKPWKDYRKIFVTESRIDKGVEFWRANASTLMRAEKEYGVPAEFIVAIIGVETYYGKRAGSYPVLDALTTLGFDYPPRGKFFRKQLKHYLFINGARRKTGCNCTYRLLCGCYGYAPIYS